MAVVEVVPPAVTNLLAARAQQWLICFQDQRQTQPPLQPQPVLVGLNSSVKRCAGCRGHESDANVVLLLKKSGLVPGRELI
jgi:hypothetical protein